MFLKLAVHAAKVCPTAPSAEVATYGNEFMSWMRWGVLLLLALGGMISIGSLVFGRVTHHPKGARLGADGLMIVIVGAVLYVTFLGVVSGITGTGC